MINVLSLFDGISGARQALLQSEINVNNYFSSEIDKYAITISKDNHKDIKHLGDVIDLRSDEITKKCKIDLLIGGSPCQDLSIAKRGREGLSGNRSNLFYQFFRLLEETKPKYFILENVASMSKADKDVISYYLQVSPIKINSSLLTAQQRNRLYWVGAITENGEYNTVDITPPGDKNIYLSDILETGFTEKLKSYAITATYSRACTRDYFMKSNRQLMFNKPVRVGHFNKGGQGDRVYSTNGKSICLSANGGGRGAKTGLYEIKDEIRKLTVTECCRLQGFPDNYCNSVSQTQAYKALGNSFTVPVISNILKQLYN